MAIETDAIVVPGDSGGPVFLDGELIGVALQPSPTEDSQKSNLVPTPLIEHFLEDLEDGSISGVPDLGISWQNVENKNLQEYLGVGSGAAGVLVTQVVAGSSADGFLESGDVIHAIDDVAVAGDGTCAPWDDQRLAFSVLVSRRQVGEVVRVDVTRRGKAMTVDVPLRKYVALVKPTYPARVDGYFILGGVVFQRVTPAYLEAWTLEKSDDRLRYHARCGLPTSDRSELVVVAQVLAHETNVGYHDVHNAIVQRLNGHAVESLADVVRAAENVDGRFHVVELDSPGSRFVDAHSVVGRFIVHGRRGRTSGHPGDPETARRSL